MGSGGRPLFDFDLNEPPTEDNDEKDSVFCCQPQKTQPSTNSHSSDLLVASTAAQGIMNNDAFSHASTVSGFQPFIRSKSASVPGADS
jgi:senataxin